MIIKGLILNSESAPAFIENFTYIRSMCPNQFINK
jgi:hypothetical protein